MKNQKFVMLDLVCYVIFPLAVWHLTREPIGDYYAMLLSSVPGIIYTVYRFMALKKVNVFGIYILTTLVIGTLLDVLAGSALQLLWNSVIFAYVLAGVFLVSILIRRPISLYFALDFTELQGYNRPFTKRLFYKKKKLTIFNWITVAFAVQDVLLASIKAWLIIEYGVEAFDKGIILRQVLNWGIAFLIMGGFFYIGKIIKEKPELVDEVKEEMGAEK
ncbi:VC0807 family protein [Halobacillus yeomjeoni]|uniref:VC0807 family protein n=1 Tax=Halobacillus yeomjeoni TaxID=311194 RepID=UPI002E24F406